MSSSSSSSKRISASLLYLQQQQELHPTASSSYQSIAEAIQKEKEEASKNKLASSEDQSLIQRQQEFKNREAELEKRRRREKLALVKTNRRNITAEEAFSLALSNVHTSTRSHHTTDYLEILKNNSSTNNNSDGGAGAGDGATVADTTASLVADATSAKQKVWDSKQELRGSAAAALNDAGALRQQLGGVGAGAAGGNKQKNFRMKQFARDMMMFDEAKSIEDNTKLQQKALRQMKLKEGVCAIFREYEEEGQLQTATTTTTGRRDREEADQTQQEQQTQQPENSAAVAATKKSSALAMALGGDESD